MSFEGYYQILCKNGHQATEDCYMFESLEWQCSVCGKKAVWRNLVDLTNGSWDDNGDKIDGYIELEIKEQPPECKCPTCGQKHESGPTIYKIPTEQTAKEIAFQKALEQDEDYEEILGIRK